MHSDYEAIKRDNIFRRGDEFDDIGTFFSEQLYSDRGHFVYELLQNAEDAIGRRLINNPTVNLPRSVDFHLCQDRLEFRHYGELFNEEDVKGITNVLKGTKSRDVNQIGKFGIGFKSVYGFTSTPEIHSGEEHFIIKRFIRPTFCEPTTEIDVGETLFIFPFNHDRVDAKECYRLIAAKLQSLGANVLLFLKHIDKIVWKVENTRAYGTYSREAEQAEAGQLVKLFTTEYLKKEIRTWMTFRRSVKTPADLAGYYNGKDVEVEVAFKLEPIPGKVGFKVIRVSDSPLVIYFPTEKLTRLGFLIQGPYVPTPSRDNIQHENDWNKFLIKATADLMPECLFHFKKAGLMCTDLLEALPIDPEDFPQNNMFRPIYDSVRETFINNSLLPTHAGDFVSANQSKLARGADLRNIFSKDQLQDLFNSNVPLFWLPGDITDRRAKIQAYIIQELGIEEVTPEMAARRLTKAFLKKQCDAWFADFYQFLDEHKDLWEKPNSIIRKKEIIRLEDNSLVVPFSEDGRANAYLPTFTKTRLHCVKRTIAEDQRARAFLKRLTIVEPNLFLEFIEFIYPKYNAPHPAVEYEANLQDLRAILSLFQRQSFGDHHNARAIIRVLLAQFGIEDSLDRFEIVGVQKLFQILIRSLPLFRSSNCANDNVFFKPANEIYLSTSDLRMYFDGNKDVWFLSDDYPDEVKNLCLELGCAKSPRKVEVNERDAQGHVVIKNKRGSHERGLHGFDPGFVIDGLDYALTNPTIYKSAYIWNELVIPNARQIRGEVESSARQDYVNSSVDTIYSKMGKLLSNSNWLPGLTGGFRKTKGFPVEELPKEFLRDEMVFGLLELRQDETAVLAEKLGVKAEHIDFLKRHLEEFEEWKKSLTERESFFNGDTEDPSSMTDRRQEKIRQRVLEAPEKVYEERPRQVRVSKRLIDPSTWLRAKYRNENGQMFCQICLKVMPFKRPDDNEYYFEAVEITNESNIEHEELYIALCPTCAAKYKVFIKNYKEKIREVTTLILNTTQREIPIKLDIPGASMKFRRDHLSDLKVILSENKTNLGDQIDSLKIKPVPLSVDPRKREKVSGDRKPEPEIIYKKGVSRVSEPPKTLVQCPYCQEMVRSDHLQRHITKACAAANRTTATGTNTYTTVSNSFNAPRVVSSVRNSKGPAKP